MSAVLDPVQLLNDYSPDGIGREWETPHASCWLGSGVDEWERHVWDVLVEEGHRGQGHGRFLMETVTAWTDWENIELTLDVYVDNTPAVNLYASLGFVTVHEGTMYSGRAYFRMRRRVGGAA